MNSTARTRDAWTAFEYKEWGDPHDEGVLEYIHSYSPYDNVKKQAYPDLLIIGSYHDSLVPFTEPTKWAARLREKKINDNPLYLKINMTSGHLPSAKLAEQLQDTAFKYAFILDEMGFQNY